MTQIKIFQVRKFAEYVRINILNVIFVEGKIPKSMKVEVDDPREPFSPNYGRYIR